MPPGRKDRPLFARWYAKVSPGMDAQGMSEYRKRALAGLAGSVIEVGAGNGLNFAHYPAGVAQVLAVEPDRYLRRIAEQQDARADAGIIEMTRHNEAIAAVVAFATTEDNWTVYAESA